MSISGIPNTAYPIVTAFPRAVRGAMLPYPATDNTNSLFSENSEQSRKMEVKEKGDLYTRF
jgi:hypothetical protein